MGIIAPVLFAGVFSEIVGIVHEPALPDVDRVANWSTADATPSCIGGINWTSNEFFVADPKEFLTPLCPSTRSVGHIREIEFGVEVLRTVFWSHSAQSLILCGLTDNTRSNMRSMSGKAKQGAALSPPRIFYK